MIENIKNIATILYYAASIFVVGLIIILTLTKKKTQTLIDNYSNKITNKKTIIIIVFVFGFVLSTLYLYLPGMIEGHDLAYRLTYIQYIANDLKKGAFPVYIFSDYLNGYGLAKGVIYSEVFYYLPAFFVCVGIPLFASYKISMLLMVLTTQIVVFFIAKKITKSDIVSVLSCDLYINSSYFLTDLYVRANFGESMAMLFIPIVIYGLYEIIYGDENKGFYFTIGLIGLYLSHVLSCFLFAFPILLFVIFNIKKLFENKKRLEKLIVYGVLSIGIVGALWLTMFDSFISDNLVITNHSNNEYTATNVTKLQYLLLEFFPEKRERWFPAGVGLVFVYYLAYFKKVVFDKRNIWNISFQLFVISTLFLTLSTDLIPWKYVSKIFGIMQFPWRFFMIATSCLLFMIILCFKNTQSDNNEKTRLLMITSLFMIFTWLQFSNYIFLEYPSFTTDYTLSYYTGSGFEIPIEADIDYINSRGETILSNNDKIEYTYIKNGSNIEIDYKNNDSDNSYLELPLVYYKGYKAKENGQCLQIEKSENGLVKINLENTSGIVDVYYGYTITRIVGCAISVSALLAFIYYTIKNNRKSIEKSE